MVTRDTPWPAGTPCWVDVTVDEVPRGIAFYQALFGWDIQQGGPETGGYAICRKNGRIVAGLSPKYDAGTPSAWTTYLATDDAGATAEKITAAGGQLLMAPVDVGEEGRMALATDTTGAVFGLWQGRRTTGIELANETASLSWNEHLSTDFDAAKAFYRAVSGYGYQDASEGSFRYAMLMVDGREVGGIGQYADALPGWQAYFAVDDTDEAVSSVMDLGGAVVRPARDSAYGRSCVVADDQGAVFSLITSPAPSVP
jgi:uncharacterized protein